MAEMKMALAKVVSKFRVEADETTKIEFQKGDQAMMSYHGVYVRLVPRWIASLGPVSIYLMKYYIESNKTDKLW